MRQAPWNVIGIGVAIGIAIGGALVAAFIAGGPLASQCPCYSAPSPWCTVHPCPGQEALNVDSSKLNTPTNITLNIRNTGVMSITLIAYYVKDTTSSLYGRPQWAGPSMQPNQVLPTIITIDGQAFTFHTGATYTVEVVTSRNNHFSFTINA